VLCRGGLGCLGAHFVGLLQQGSGLALRVGSLPAAPPFIGLTLLQVSPPAKVVHIDLGTVGVEMEHLVHRGLQQRNIVTDHHQATLPRPQEVT
jgi:hypothetical protein